jgi:hypothetical protein
MPIARGQSAPGVFPPATANPYNAPLGPAQALLALARRVGATKWAAGFPAVSGSPAYSGCTARCWSPRRPAAWAMTATALREAVSRKQLLDAHLVHLVALSVVRADSTT